MCGIDAGRDFIALFSVFLNDFELSCITNGAVEYHFGELSLFLLLYADDLVLFSESVLPRFTKFTESVEGLQNLLDNLNVYANKWHLTVSRDTAHVVAFRNGGKVKDFET